MATVPRIAATLGLACGITWGAVYGLAVFGPLAITEWYDLLLLVPLGLIISSLAVFMRNSRAGRTTLLQAVVLALITTFIGGGALAVLPGYDGDGLWPLSLWLGAIAVSPLAVARMRQAEPLRPDLRS